MGKWKTVRLGDYIEQIRGVSYKPEDALENEDETHIPILRAHNIQTDGLNDNNLIYVDARKIKSNQYIRKGDIIVCASSGSKDLVGKAAQATTNLIASFGAFCKVVRANDTINSAYLRHYFSSPIYRHVISELSAGANINNLRNEHIDNLCIPLPPLDVQQRIADVLDKASALIELRKDQLDKLDLLIKSQFIEMFADAYEDCKMMYLPDVCQFIDYRGKTPEKSDTGIPLITAKNVKNNHFSIEPREYIPIDNYDNIMTRGIPKNNDVLFTTEAPLGNVCRIPPVFERFCVGQRIITMQPYSKIVTAEYLEKALLTQQFQDSIWQKSSGSTVKGIRSKELALLSIPVPEYEKQNEFSHIVQQLEAQKKLLQQSLDKLELNYKSLMQKCFRGEIF